ncbi:MAG: FtsQ-type POTRA domain-containing protein [Capsulimonadaceae bacterium]|nr:FtsQ-type POTRA domain-containing protein [Capsulimonadaceae bacterium]
MKRNRKRKNRWPAIRRTLLFGLVLALLIWLCNDRRFEIRQVRVDGLRTVGLKEIITLAKVKMGGNLFVTALVDHRDITRRIEKAEPAVESAAIRIHPPKTLVVRIQERTPYAQIRINGGPLLLVDASGIPYRQITARAPSLPALVVPSTTVVPELGKKIDQRLTNPLGTAFSVLNLLTHGDYFVPLKLREIRVQGDLYTSVYMTDRPVIRLGLPGDYPLKIKTAAVAIEGDPVRAQNAEYVDVTLPSKPAIKMKVVAPKPL